uniref:rho guanine nucleotide exchange factor TIAM2-like isoform X2 n=1 Tax=Myxine glutinosa TaxID=7769 RepID=UPI00358EAC7D
MEPPLAPDPDPPVKSNMSHLRKVMVELMETEHSYVQDLLTLRNSYIEPIRREGCLSLDQVEELFGSLTPLTEFQLDFLKALEQGLKVLPDIEKLKDKTQVKRMLFSLGGAFLYYSEHFKLYGAYCANYHKAQRVLEKAKKDGHFQKFINSLNPSGQHSSTLESFLIKPIQRILKYPLLLRELCSVVDMDSEEGYHLSEALKAMNETASHINEMQKLYEIYGKHFDELMLEHKMDTDEPTDLSMGDLLAHGNVCWLNSARGPTDTHIFVFKKAVVLICKDFLKNRRRSCQAQAGLSAKYSCAASYYETKALSTSVLHAKAQHYQEGHGRRFVSLFDPIYGNPNAPEPRDRRNLRQVLFVVCVTSCHKI